MDDKTIKVPFFRLGKWKHPQYGNLEGTQEKFDSIIENFHKNVLGRPPYIRLGHTKDNAPTFGDAPAEAWVYDVVQEGPVLFALAHPTGDEIVSAIREKRFRFASPEYQENYTNKESGMKAGPTLMAIGLTNEPFLTRLPDTVALAEHPDEVYLDYEEEVTRVDDTLVKKFSEVLNSFIEKLKTAVPGTSGLTMDERAKLNEVDALKTQLAQSQEQMKLAEGRISAAENAAWSAQVESRLADLVAKGIPPAMCEPVKAVLLANPAAASTMIKLADNKEISLAEQLYASLEALPEEHRIKLVQMGRQEAPADSPEAIKKLADEDVLAMGGKINEDGTYVL
ncbi:MAG TPA: phage protease [Syntrophomonadaceae bacterium]|nr:phage protease [Syntrophomonadaceae bacterium]